MSAVTERREANQVLRAVVADYETGWSDSFDVKVLEVLAAAIAVTEAGGMPRDPERGEHKVEVDRPVWEELREAVSVLRGESS